MNLSGTSVENNICVCIASSCIACLSRWNVCCQLLLYPPYRTWPFPSITCFRWLFSAASQLRISLTLKPDVSCVVTWSCCQCSSWFSPGWSAGSSTLVSVLHSGNVVLVVLVCWQDVVMWVRRRPAVPKTNTETDSENVSHFELLHRLKLHGQK